MKQKRFTLILSENERVELERCKRIHGMKNLQEITIWTSGTLVEIVKRVRETGGVFGLVEQGNKPKFEPFSIEHEENKEVRRPLSNFPLADAGHVNLEYLKKEVDGIKYKSTAARYAFSKILELGDKIERTGKRPAFLESGKIVLVKINMLQFRENIRRIANETNE